MNITEKIDFYLNEGKMEVGDYIFQRGSDFESYGVLTRQLKNGGFYAKVFTSYDGSTAGKAKQKSTKGWHPAPVVIDKDKIPPKILQKL